MRIAGVNVYAVINRLVQSPPRALAEPYNLSRISLAGFEAIFVLSAVPGYLIGICWPHKDAKGARNWPSRRKFKVRLIMLFDNLLLDRMKFSAFSLLVSVKPLFAANMTRLAVPRTWYRNCCLVPLLILLTIGFVVVATTGVYVKLSQVSYAGDANPFEDWNGEQWLTFTAFMLNLLNVTHTSSIPGTFASVFPSGKRGSAAQESDVPITVPDGCDDQRAHVLAQTLIIDALMTRHGFWKAFVYWFNFDQSKFRELFFERVISGTTQHGVRKQPRLRTPWPHRT